MSARDDKSVLLKRRPAALIVLKALLNGSSVMHGGEEWCYESGAFGVLRTQIDGTTGQETDILLKVDMDIVAFIAWCERMSEEDVIKIVFNSALKSMKRPRLP